MAKKSTSKLSKTAGKEKKEGKAIVLFSDGTGNSAAKLQKTNVWRIFEALDKTPKNKSPQIAFYDNGVGTSSFRPLQLLGGIFGFGLKRNVCELYAFLCTHYEPGDRIYMFGFSRGAFTIRLLAALINQEGILQVKEAPTQGGQHVGPADLMRYSKIAYQHMTSAFNARWSPLVLSGRWIRRAWTNWSNFIARKPAYDTRKHFGGNRKELRTGWASGPQSDINRITHVHDPSKSDVRITFMGLFDTVSAYGGPSGEFTRAFSWLFFPIEPDDWNLGNNVDKACHALALDDTRQTFHPKPFNEVRKNWKDPDQLPSRYQQPANNISDETHFSQVWFSGAHSDVGGGYANDGLSIIPLMWMIGQAGKAGLEFDETKVLEFKQQADVSAPIHDARSGLSATYRYQPRSLKKISNDFSNKIYLDDPKIHHSVFDRMALDKTYAPITPDRPYRVVGPDNDILPPLEDGKIVPAHNHEYVDRTELPPGNLLTAIRRSLPPVIRQFTRDKYWNFHLQNAWDLVLYKRLIYFLSAAIGLFLLFMPFLPECLKFLWNRACFITLNDVQTGCQGWYCEFGFFFTMLEAVLPSIATNWLQMFTANMGIVLSLLGIAFALLLLGNSLQRRVNASLEWYWHRILDQKDISTGSQTLIHKMRSWPVYEMFFHAVRYYLGPIIWGSALLLVALIAANKTLYTLRNPLPFEWASGCPSVEAADADFMAKQKFGPKQEVMGEYDLRDGCNPIGDQPLIAGETYLVTIYGDGGRKAETLQTVQTKEQIQKLEALENPFGWKDLDHPASPLGIDRDDEGWVMKLTRPTLRNASADYFTPVLRIGAGLPEEIILSRDKIEIELETRNSVTFKVTSRKGGMPYFYVNDVPNGFWRLYCRSENGEDDYPMLPPYCNNIGTGEIYIRSISES